MYISKIPVKAAAFSDTGGNATTEEKTDDRVSDSAFFDQTCRSVQRQLVDLINSPPDMETLCAK